MVNAIEELIKPSHRKFENKLIHACSLLQGTQMYRANNCNEDDRNSYIASLLEAGGEYAKDQTKWSVSHGGIQPGEIDIFIKNTDGKPFTIIEGMNLKSVNKSYIDLHLEKTFDYDVTGLPDNYILIYYISKNFNAFCNRYKNYIENKSYDYNLYKIEEIDLMWAEMIFFKAHHMRNNKKINLNHIVINLGDL